MSIAALIEAVEAGNDLPRPMPFNVSEAACIIGAYHGSLDAAMALHEALLPGWDWWINSKHYWDKDEGPLAVLKTGTPGIDLRTTAGKAPTPARAWLLAILRAKEAGQ